MGITHYWERETELEPMAFARASVDCKRILDSGAVKLAGSTGDGVPLFENDTIAFNGARPSTCEPFEVHTTEFDRRGRKRFFQSCKTEGLPYGIAVHLALIVLNHHLGAGFAVESDEAEKEWQKAKEMCQMHLGYGGDFRLRQDE